MKSVVCFAFFVVAISASPALDSLLKRDSGSCPVPSGMVSICLFVPGVNCIQDNECSDGKLCCSEGCGKICKDPVTHGKREVTHAGSCPKTDQNMFGFCIFRPGINCMSDDQCTTDQKCCQEGCGKVCKSAV